MATKISKGDTVTFNGFPDDIEDAPPLVEGEEYIVADIGKDDEGTYYTIRIPNPGKKGEVINVDVYRDEITLVGDDEEETEAPIEFADVIKGDYLSIEDVGGNTYVGEITKKTKTLLHIEHDGTSVNVRAKDITSIVPADEARPVEEPEQEAAPAPKAKAKTKKKVVAKKKATAKKAAPVEEDEEEEEVESKSVQKRKAAQKKTVAKKAVAKRGRGRPKLNKAAETTEDDDNEFKDMTLIDREDEDQDILALVDGADDILELAQEMAEEAANMDYQLGGILYHVRVSKEYKKLKPEYAERGGFGKYTEEQLGMHYRKCMYLIDIYSVWNKFKLDKDWISAQGWSKALLVAKNVDEDNVEDLMAVAETQSVADLRDTIKESFSRKGEDSREVVKKISFKFRLMEEEAAMVTGYLEAAMKQLGKDNPAEAFEYIITEWAQEHLDISKTKSTKRRAVDKAKQDAGDEEEVAPKSQSKPKARRAARSKQRGAQHASA